MEGTRCRDARRRFLSKTCTICHNDANEDLSTLSFYFYFFFVLPFKGEKNNGFDVLYHNMKHGVIASKELAEFLRERSAIEENNYKLLSKVAKQASSSTQGTFAPVWAALRGAAEKLAVLHLQMAQRVAELIKDVSKYADELHKRHKAVRNYILLSPPPPSFCSGFFTSLLTNCVRYLFLYSRYCGNVKVRSYGMIILCLFSFFFAPRRRTIFYGYAAIHAASTLHLISRLSVSAHGRSSGFSSLVRPLLISSRNCGLLYSIQVYICVIDILDNSLLLFSMMN